MIISGKVSKKLLLSTILFVIFISFCIILISINFNEKEKIKGIENNIIEKTKSHYNHIKEIQLWYTDHLKDYMKEDDINNSELLIHKKLLQKYSHYKITKQYSRYAKKFDSFYFKLTSLNPLNQNNLPDRFEKKALSFLHDNQDSLFYHKNIEDAIQEGTFDFLGKLMVSNQCLQCHQVQGYKEGDIRGGVRITIDTTLEKEIIENIKEYFFKLKTLSILAGLLFLILSYKITNYIFKQQKELQELNENLEDLVGKRTLELQELNESLEDRIAEAVEKNQEQEKLMLAQSRHAAMGEMIHMIAHQWRQPIAAISMGANNIILDIELDDIEKENFTEMAQDILGQTKYLTKTIDDFSNFFKPTKEKSQIFPQEVIEESISIIGKSLENNGINLVLKLDDTIEIKTYSRELLQVLINLLKNAKEAFERSSCDEKTITIQLKENDQSIIIAISDNAGGIPDEIKGKIFDPYFSTKKEKNGTGLGLYMSKTIVSKHLYGELYLKNTPQGAMFIIELPKN